MKGSHILKLQAAGTVCVKPSEMRCSEFNREFSGVRKRKVVMQWYTKPCCTILSHEAVAKLSTGKTTVLSGTQKQRVKERNWERSWQIFRNEHHGNILRRSFYPFKWRLREWQSKKKWSRVPQETQILSDWEGLLATHTRVSQGRQPRHQSQLTRRTYRDTCAATARWCCDSTEICSGIAISVSPSDFILSQTGVWDPSALRF